MANLKYIFLLIGSAAGIYSFFRLVGQDMFSFFNKPKLIIEFSKSDDVKAWRVGPPYIPNIETRKVATIHIHNKGRKPALDCEALVKILKDNKQLMQPLLLPLHWADTPYDARSTSIERVVIGKLPRRLDVAFTQERQNKSGCSIASAQALATGVRQDQFFLPQGEHKIKIYINYNSGNSIERTFIIKSPDTWQNLEMEIA